MFLGTNQDVRGRLRADVFEGEDIGIFVHNFGQYFLACDFTKQAVGTH
jgi:hypothetical protein